MADAEQIEKLIELGRDPASIARIQEEAKDLMEAGGAGCTLRLACAATLSCFLNRAGVDVTPTLGAGRLAARLEKDRGWQRISVGWQLPGDVGVTIDADPTRPGGDHVYLVVDLIEDDLMLIVDNQVAGRPHHRSASGKRRGDMKSGRTGTAYFLRPAGRALPMVQFAASDEDDMPDVFTDFLPEPHDARTASV